MDGENLNFNAFPGNDILGALKETNKKVVMQFISMQEYRKDMIQKYFKESKTTEIGI